MRRTLKFSASEAGGTGKRLDAVVAALTGVARTRATQHIEEGHALVNGQHAKPAYKLKHDDTITLSTPEADPAETDSLIPEDIPINVLYADEDLAVVDKPAGMVVYPAAGHAGGTLMNALCHRFGPLKAVGGPLRPGVVHRLDKDTSGVMVVALSDQAYYNLVEQFKLRSIQRQYRAIVYGSLRGASGVIEVKIGRSVTDRKKMSTRTRLGKEAKTSWEVVARLKGATLIKAKLGTGRTHQIRVHFAHIGHPVLGDSTYGNKTAVILGATRIDVPRQMLHAETLGFIHPVTGREMSFKSPVPDDMQQMISTLGGFPYGGADRG